MSVQTIDDSDESTRINQSADIPVNQTQLFHIQKTLYYLVLFILIFSVLFRAGNRPLPMMILEIAAVGLLLICFLKPVSEYILPLGLKILLLVMCIFPLLYLIPLPWEIWTSLPGRDLYGDTLQLFDTSNAFRAASVYPLKTQLSWLALLPPVAIFVASLRLTSSQIQTLVFVIIGIAVFEAVLGLIQYGDGITSRFHLNNPYASGSASGTYPNRNHLAGLLEMVLPIGLGLLALSVGRTRTELHYHRSWRARIASLSGWHTNKAVVYAFICILILLGLIFTQSRSGVALAMLGVLLSAIAYSRRLGGTNVFGVMGSFFAVVTAIAIEIGLAPLLQRFSVDHLANLRFTIFSNTIEGIGTFFPIGSGPGTFPFIYPRFQSIEENAFTNHAHNDYLEWMMEGGLVAGVLIIACLWLYFRHWPKVWSKGYWSTFQFIKVGAGIGIFLMMLHGLTDFNLHIPANAIYFAFLAAVFFYPQNRKEHSIIDNESRKAVKQNNLQTDDVSVGQVTLNQEQHNDSDTNSISNNTIKTTDKSKLHVKNITNKPEDISNPFEEKEE